MLIFGVLSSVVIVMTLEKYRFGIALLFVLIVIKTWGVLQNFHFYVTDNDQAIMWLGSFDLSQGHWYTPFFYGCNYGSMFESLAALPFYWLGLPLYKALPVSNMVWLTLGIGALAIRSGRVNPWYGIFTLLFFAFLPTDYFILGFAAKGHLSGTLLAIIAYLIYRRSRTVAAILFGVALGFNPNTVFMGLLFFLDLKTWKSALLFVLFSIPSFLVYRWAAAQWLEGVDVSQLHQQWAIAFDWDLWLENLGFMDRYLNAVSPLFHGAGYFVLLTPLLLLVVTWKRETWIQRSVLAGYFLLVLLSLGVNKLADGTNDLLFHYSRFYLGMGLVSAHLLGRLTASIRRGNILMGTWVGMTAYLMASMVNLGVAIKQQADRSGQTYAVEKTYIEDMLKKAEWLNRIVKKESDTLPMVLTTDYPLYTESIWLRTQDINYTVVLYDAPKYPWMYEEVKDQSNADLLMVVEFPSVLEENRIRHAKYLNRDEGGVYFVLRNTSNWKQRVSDFLQE